MAYFRGNLNEETSMEPPEGFEDFPAPNGCVYRLKKALYGLGPYFVDISSSVTQCFDTEES